MTLPKFEDWKAPWETADGKDVPDEEQKVDRPKLKKYLFGLLSDKERLQTSVATVTGERDELQKKVDEVARKDETEVDRLKRENQELEARLAKGSEDSTEKQNLRLRVALEKGLNLDQAERLRGDTEEEMTVDADKLVASFGGSGKGDDEGDEGPPQRQPRRLHSPGDPDPAAGTDIPVDKLIDSIPRL